MLFCEQSVNVWKGNLATVVSSSLTFYYKAKRMRKAIISENNPMASDNAKPRMAYEKSCCFSDGFLQ